MSESVAVLGGSFDPPHLGHVLLAATVLCTSECARLLVVPVRRHVFDKALSPFEARVELCELAFAPLRGVEVSRVEAELPEPSVTLRTLEELGRRMPGARLRLVVGSDVLSEVHRWHSWPDVVRAAPPLIVGRSGHPHPDAPAPLLPEISSSEVRGLLGGTLDARDRARLEALLPRSVLRRIEECGLYGRGAEGGG